MNKLLYLTLLVLVAAVAFGQQAGRVADQNFASDFQTVPVMANTTGIGGTFQSYVAIFNPTSSSFTVDVTLYDSNGTKRNATITLAAGELKTYANFLLEVFNYAGGGAVTFQSAGPNNRFIVSSEVRTGGTNYSTPVPSLEFAGSSSRSFSAGVTVDTTARTNVGCFNQSDVVNRVNVTVFDKTGKLTLGTTALNLSPNAWGQTSINAIVSDGFVQFDPAEAAVCYAVVVPYSTNDGRFISAVEYKP